MKILTCPACGGPVTFNEAGNYYVCDFCMSHISAQMGMEDRLVQLKERASRLFQGCDFEGAAALYQNVVSECPNDAESYWFLAMCAYGIQYVDDPMTGKRVPTCNRTLYTSILNNEDYLNALKYADAAGREAYEKTARQIDEIQKEILDIVKKEEPYDIFLSYKETDERGLRTKEGDIAKDLYYKLISARYRVFYAPETLREVAGHKYEPYIFAALNSAKIMICIGFSPAHFNAPWVKNEWTRFMARVARNPRLILLTCFNSYLMSGSDIPALLGKSQAVDMANTSTNDLLGQVSKLLPREQEKAPAVSAAAVNMMGSNAAAQCKRGYVYLEDRQFKEATSYFNKSLDQNPELSKAYWGLLLTKLECCNGDELVKLGKPISNTNEYKKALRFASGAEQDEYLEVASRIDKKIRDAIYQLTVKQAAVLESSDIAEGLEKQKTVMDQIWEDYTKLAAEMQATEQAIAKNRDMCDRILKPYVEYIYNVHQLLGKLVKETNGKSTCPTGQFKSVTDYLDELKKELHKNLEKVQQIKSSEPCFRELNQGIQRQKELKKLLKECVGDYDDVYGILEEHKEQLEGVLNLFRPTWQQVEQGNFKLYNTLMERS